MFVAKRTFAMSIVILAETLSKFFRFFSVCEALFSPGFIHLYKPNPRVIQSYSQIIASNHFLYIVMSTIKKIVPISIALFFSPKTIAISSFFVTLNFALI